MRSLEAINVNIGAKQLSPSIITLWHAKEKKDAFDIYFTVGSVMDILRVVK